MYLPFSTIMVLASTSDYLPKRWKDIIMQIHAESCLQQQIYSKSCKQPICPSTDEWIKKTQCLCTMLCFLIQKHGVESFVGKQMHFATITLSEMSRMNLNRAQFLLHEHRVQMKRKMRQMMRNRDIFASKMGKGSKDKGRGRK